MSVTIQAVCSIMCIWSCALLIGQDGSDASTPMSAQGARTMRLCSMLSDPKAHLGEIVDVQARITSMKEGSSIWDPACPNLGAILIVDPWSNPDPSIRELDRMMRLHGLSD